MEEIRICKDCGQSKPIDEFQRNRWGYTHSCKECAAKKSTEKAVIKKEQKKIDGLATYTPRELLTELKKRGYKWENMYVTIKQEIDYNKI